MAVIISTLELKLIILGFRFVPNLTYFAKSHKRWLEIAAEPPFPHTNSFPDYHPHLTIGYLKSGRGKKYVKKLNGLKFQLTPEYVIYSMPNGDQDKLEIKI